MEVKYRDIQNWRKNVSKALEIAETWERILKNWKVLYSLFSFSELSLQLSKEATEFKAVSKKWLDVMTVCLISKYIECKTEPCSNGFIIPE